MCLISFRIKHSFSLKEQREVLKMGRGHNFTTPSQSQSKVFQSLLSLRESVDIFLVLYLDLQLVLPSLTPPDMLPPCIFH